MMLKIKTAPTVEPVSLSEMKLHLRVDGSDEDALINGLITLAREDIERMTNRMLITQVWELVLDSWPASPFELGLGPVQSVDSIKYTDEDGDESTFSSDNYLVDTYAYRGRVALKSDASWPSEPLAPIAGVKITFTGGFGDAAAAVPTRFKQALKLLVGHHYENREAVSFSVGGNLQVLPMGVTALLADDIRRTY